MDKSCRVRGYRLQDELNGLGIGLNSRTLLIINLPDSRSLRIVSRSLFLAMFLVALPSIASIIRASNSASTYNFDAVSSDGFTFLPIILRDLLDDGLLKRGHKGLVLGDANEDDLELLRNNGIDLLTGPDLRNNNESVDYVYTPSFRGIHLVDEVLKDGGLLISPLGIDPSIEQRLLENFKIVYIRRFDNTVAAMKKMEDSLSSVENSVLCGITTEKKKSALKVLEDIYLEPPNRSSITSRKNFKFLPDLLNESLDEYPRRVFITDESSALDWFYINYPMRDRGFEVYDMALENGGSVSDLMMKIGVRGVDYVVVKVEAYAVEQMMRDETICVVDELFIECRIDDDDDEKMEYSHCLDLHGRVRNEGIAVHQWWH